MDNPFKNDVGIILLLYNFSYKKRIFVLFLYSEYIQKIHTLENEGNYKYDLTTLFDIYSLILYLIFDIFQSNKNIIRLLGDIVQNNRTILVSSLTNCNCNVHD